MITKNLIENSGKGMVALEAFGDRKEEVGVEDEVLLIYNNRMKNQVVMGSGVLVNAHYDAQVYILNSIGTK